jgi:hypothetical protein
MLSQATDKDNKNATGKNGLLNLGEAAAYTGRSRRTFQRECKLGIWTSIQIGGGHPKFRPEDLETDMEAWVLRGKFRPRR